MDMLTITIMIVDSHCLILEGIKRLLEDVAEFKVIAAVQDGIAAMEQLKRQKPDVILMDTQLPQQSGLETCRLITGKYPSTRVIMLTNDTNDLYLLDAIRAGAKGYLRKSISLQDLTKAIHMVYRKGTLLPLFTALRESHKGTRAHCGNTELLQDLTLREREILPLIVEGQTTDQIAEFFCISPKTVRNHLSHIYKRLGTRDRLQTILYMSQKQQKQASLSLHGTLSAESG